MNELHIERIKAAVQAQRQDDEALSLYWNFIETESAATSSERFRHLLIEAYRLLYTARQTQPEPHSFDALVDSACQRRFSDVSVLAFLAEGEFDAKRYDNALKLYDRLLTLKAFEASKSYS